MTIFRRISFALRMAKLGSDKSLVSKVLNSKDVEATVSSYYSDQDQVEDLQDRLHKIENDRDRLKGDKRELKKDLSEVKDSLANFREGESHPKAEYWNNKYEKKLVRYKRPIYDGNDVRVEDIPVTNFIQKNDLVIRETLEEEGLFVEDPLQVDEIVPEIYHLAKEEYDYEYDRNNLGRLEFWLLPFETRELNGDCEDWSMMIASYLLAAGVPSWRIRVIAGGTLNENYGGHATVYVLGDDLETWYHLNSTTPEHHHDKLSEYPTWGEDTGLNIDPDDVWVAFNDRYGWQDFESDASRENFENSKISDKMTVEER